jgi:hypothetical protein
MSRAVSCTLLCSRVEFPGLPPKALSSSLGSGEAPTGTWISAGVGSRKICLLELSKPKLKSCILLCKELRDVVRLMKACVMEKRKDDANEEEAALYTWQKQGQMNLIRQVGG